MKQPSVTSSRRAALEVLRRVRAGDLADRALDRAIRDLPPREVPWTQELVYGTLRLRGRLDFILGAQVRAGLGSLEPDVLDILRLGLYQLLEMDSVPPYAAISQTVDLAKVSGARRASGLVNGVLQSVQRKRESIRFPDSRSAPLRYLAAWGSHPEWMLERWIDRWGAEEVGRLVEANNRRPELFLRPLRHSTTEAVAILAESGIVAEPVPFAPDAVRLLPPAGAREALAVLPAVVQDPAASLVTRYAALPEDAQVLDLCAAPGGKALGLATHARFVAAADVSFGRLQRVRENVERVTLGSRVGLVVADARHPPFAPADAVLLDAPCTGTGTFRRHPDGRWRLSEENLNELVRLQRTLLDNAASLVRPGGILVYSTCSLEREENEEQVEEFLSRHGDFRCEPESDVVESSLLTPEGFLSVLPQRHGVDGSFAARLRRVD